MESDVKTSVKDNIHLISINRPKKKNAISLQMYSQIADCLETAANDETTITVLTGEGDYFSSGNDLSGFMSVDPSRSAEAAAADAARILERFVSSFIDFPKPLIAVVNGPAVGIAVTILGLFDAVYATDKATFNTPFSLLGQSPEGCSSLTFPQIMGHTKACEVLLFNKTLTANEALDRGLVTAVFRDDSFRQQIWPHLISLAKLPKNALRSSKNLIRSTQRSVLHDVNKKECQLLVERWQSEECMAAIMDFFQKKSKL